MKQINMFYLFRKNGHYLRDLIEIDVPFLMDERMARLEELEDILFKANFSTAENLENI